MPRPIREEPRRKSAPPKESAPWRGLRIRALVLAAGLGTRLRPLTEGIPKPLLPVLGRPILTHTLRRLAAIGCEAVAINLHYLGSQIRAALGTAFAGMPLVYSEEPEPLGTLGALPPLRDFFSAADLIVLINGDSLCQWPLDRLLRHHLKEQPRATLLLASRPDPEAFGGGVATDRQGGILAFRRSDPRSADAKHRRVFAGAHVFQPRLVGETPAGFADIVRDLYEPMLRRGDRLDAVVTDLPWHDLGTPRRYLEAVLDRARTAKPTEEGVLFSGPGVSLASTSRVRRSVLESGVVVEPDASVEGSVLLAGAKIGPGAELRETLVGPGVSVPPGARLERSLVVARATSPVEAGGWISLPLDPA